MAKCAKTGSGCCTCNVKKKRKATARRPPPAPVYKGVSVNVLGGTEQQYVNNLMAYLQNLNKPQVAQSVGIAVPVRPVMVSGATQTAVGTRTGGTQTGVGTATGATQTGVGTRTGGTQTAVGTATIGTGTDARAAMVTTGTGTDARAAVEYGTQTYGTQVLRRPRPAMVTTGTDARPITATMGTQVSAAEVAALVPLPPSPPSVVGVDTRGYGMQTEPQGTGARAVARLFGAIRPAIIAERAANIQQAQDVGMAEGYRQGRQRGEAIGAVQGAAEAIAGLTFTQRTGARGVETFTVPELQQRFAEGAIIRGTGGRRAGGGGGGGGAEAAVQAVAEEAAPK